MSNSWFFLQRLLAPQAAVFQEELKDGRPILNLLTQFDLQRLAAASMPARRRAA